MDEKKQTITAKQFVDMVRTLSWNDYDNVFHVRVYDLGIETPPVVSVSWLKGVAEMVKG